MLERKIASQLLHWKEDGGRKALLIKGARQVGKTTTVRAFAAQHYDHLVEVNFERMPSARQAFDGNLDARTVLINLSAMGFGPLVPSKTLIFFDEIQACPNARTAIKFLVEDGRFDYIESGSLLGINYGEVRSYPVGFEHQLSMFPLDFEEYLWACGIAREVVDTLRECFESRWAVPQFLHQQIMARYREYLVVGGMPEVVSTFLGNVDLERTLSVQRDIVSGYRNDISKYAGRDKLLAKSVFDAIPSQLSKQDKRFVLASLEKNASQRKYGAPTQWLADAGMAYFSFNVRNFDIPLPLTENVRLYKLFMVDTGLLCSMMLDGGMQSAVLAGDVDINEGALTGNYVAGELVKHGKALHYYDHKSRQELDFIFADGRGISIIEVKAGKEYKKHASLTAALTLFKDKVRHAFVLSKNNLELEGGVVYLPLYMSMFI